MRNRVVQLALSVALLVLLVQVVLIAPSQIRDADTKNEASAPLPEMPRVGDDVDQSIKGFHMIETQEGQKEWEVWADQAVSMKSKDMMQMDQVKAIFFSESGSTFTVTGKKGTVQVSSKDLRVVGDVVIRSSNGYVFRTDDMQYYSKKRILTTDSRVVMTGPPDGANAGLKLTGAGMNASLDKSTMEVLRDVRADKNIDSAKRALIRSHRAVFSGKDRTARFLGEVTLDVDSMRITGPEANFQYDGKSDMVKSVLFTGGARVSDADKWATAQNVSVDFDTNRFVFRGNPRVVQNNDELRGEQIVFLDGGKRVQVLKARAKVDEKRLEGAN